MRHIFSYKHYCVRLLVLVLLAPLLVTGQDPGSPRPTTQDPSQVYRIGIGDLLLVRVFGHPELGGDFPVNNHGNIRLPFFDEMMAACRTELELATNIGDKFRKYLRNPQVDVVVKEYRSQPVAVIGAIVHPSRFQLQRRVRLLEIIANAGGPAPNAGINVFVIHNPDQATCAQEGLQKANDESGAGATAEVTDAGQPVLSTYKLRDLMTGAPAANHYVQPGDVISIPEADKVYLTGHVLRPGGVTLQGGLTLLNAIAMAGGFDSVADKKNIRLIRPGPDGKRQEQVFNANDIAKNKADDVVLLANDLIHVPSSLTKNIVKSLYQVVPATVSALPILILP